MMIVYGYLVLMGANLIGDGGELLMELRIAPGIIGGLVLPVIGALPDSIIILTAGLSGTHSGVQEMVAVGVGTLAGSTLMLLTLVWGGSLLCGRCDMSSQGTQVSRKLTDQWDLMNTGVSTDSHTPHSARAMLMTSLLYLVVQIPAFFSARAARPASLLGFILCVLSLLAYCGFHIITPEYHKWRAFQRKTRRMRYKTIRALTWLAGRYGGMLDEEGAVRREATDSIFERFDRNSSGFLEEEELKGMILGLEMARDIHSPKMFEELDFWLSEFKGYAKEEKGTQSGVEIDKEGFYTVLSRWAAEKRARIRPSSPKEAKKFRKDPVAVLTYLPKEEDEEQPVTASASYSSPLVEPLLIRRRSWSSYGSSMCMDDLDELDLAENQDQSTTTRNSGLEGWPTWKVAALAGAKFLLGTCICSVFSDPFVGSVADLSRATGIPAFFIAFVVAPLASNASELVSSLRFASGKKVKNISLTFHQVYGAVTMNNTMCLGLFLLVVYVQHLQWVYSVEVLLVVLPTWILGLFAARRESFRAIWALPVIAMYFLVLGGEYVFHHMLHYQ